LNAGCFAGIAENQSGSGYSRDSFKEKWRNKSSLTNANIVDMRNPNETKLNSMY